MGTAHDEDVDAEIANNQPLTTYTVIGVWANDAAVVAGVVVGTVKLVDSFEPENDGDFGRWAVVVEATSPDEAETMAITSIEAQEYGVNLDMESSASRQHYIDTGRYLRKGEAIQA